MIQADQYTVQQTLAPYEQAILSVVHGAWDDWMELPEDARVFCKRTRASIVHDYMMARAGTAFANDPDVRIIHKDQTAKFLFCKKVLLRLKKGNPKGLGSNIETNADLRFTNPLADFLNLPDVQKVEVVYMLNGIATKIHNVSVTARDRDRILWSYDLGDAGSAEVMEFPQPSAPPESGIVIQPRHTHVSKGKDRERNGSR